MATDLFTVTSDTLDRLGDLDNDIWARSEIEIYLQDASDLFTRRTKCIYDRVVIPNLTQAANWTTDLEYSFISQRPGSNLSDMPIQRTGDEALGVTGRVGGAYGQPFQMTSPFRTANTTTDAAEDIPGTIPGGRLPTSTVDVIRVAYDETTLAGTSSQQMRQMDQTYETRTGDPQWFIWDKDGLFYVRVVPAATGNATYPVISGSWGTRTSTDDADVTASTNEASGHETGGYGILRAQTDTFPAGGPWGSPTIIHPSTDNIVVEVNRLGRALTSYPLEIPEAYRKYVVYWAMSRALRREGPGQDIELSDHYADRFTMGVSRMIEKRDKLQQERVGMFGGSPGADGLGWPQPPSGWGVPR